MDRDVALPFVVAAVAVVALAVAAATLDSAVVTDAGLGFGGGGDGTGIGGGEHAPVGTEDDLAADDRSTGDFAFGVCWPVVRELPVLLALGLCFLGLFAAAYRSTGSPFAGGVVCLAAALPVGLAWALLAFCSPPTPPAYFTPQPTGGGNESTIPDGGGGGGFGDAATETVSSPSVLVGLLVAVAVAILVVALLFGRRRDTDDEGQEGTPPEEPPEPMATAVGRAAGAAANRIEADADAENEVYRAWRRMTGALDVDSPETTTPAQFADAAVDAGMEPADVSELTDLFETVRYGGVEPTAERERRAVATLRRIEAGYGGD